MKNKYIFFILLVSIFLITFLISIINLIYKSIYYITGLIVLNFPKDIINVSANGHNLKAEIISFYNIGLTISVIMIFIGFVFYFIAYFLTLKYRYINDGKLNLFLKIKIGLNPFSPDCETKSESNIEYNLWLKFKIISSLISSISFIGSLTILFSILLSILINISLIIKIYIINFWALINSNNIYFIIFFISTSFISLIAIIIFMLKIIQNNVIE